MTSEVISNTDGFKPSLRTKAWVKRRLTRMAHEEGKELEELEPRYKAPSLSPVQREEINKMIEPPMQLVKRWFDEKFDPNYEKAAAVVYGVCGGNDKSFVTDELHMLYMDADESCPHDKGPEWWWRREEAERSREEEEASMKKKKTKTSALHGKPLGTMRLDSDLCRVEDKDP